MATHLDECNTNAHSSNNDEVIFKVFFKFCQTALKIDEQKQ